MPRVIDHVCAGKLSNASFTAPSVAAFLAFACLPLLAQTAPPAATQPEPPLARDIRAMLAEGKLAEALAYSDKQYKANPDDAIARRVYTELRMTVARQAIAAQRFQQAEQLLRQVVAADPKHGSAGKMIDMIVQARSRVEPALADAKQLLRLERFEQSAAIFAQAAGLIPDKPDRWKQSWMSATIGAGDDHYLMRNYEAALPFYTQAIELGGAAGPGETNNEQLLWRWSHCFAMNLARTPDVPRSAAQWAGIIDTAKDRFQAARADSLGLFVAAVGRQNMSDVANAIPLYRQLLGAAAPVRDPRMAPSDEAKLLREKAVQHLESLYRGEQIARRGGAFAVIVPGKPIERRSGKVLVRARNDLLARRVLEVVEYHAPRLVEYLGGNKDDLNWPVDFLVVVQPKADGQLGDMFVPSYSRIQSQDGRLVLHETICLQTDPLLIGATIPHELTHVLISRLAGYTAIPLAIDEGLSIHAETTARYLMFRRALLSSGGAKMTVAQLLAADKMPDVGQRPAFYAECYNLVAWLLTRGKPARVIEMCRLVRRLSPADALLKTYEFADMATAEKAYQAFLQDQGLAKPQ